jgi:membrane-anchored glycerophosphoryl diester phosphodiesterase (GDPDase)
VTIKTIAARLAGQGTGLRRALRSGSAQPGSLRQVAVLVVGAPAILTLLFLPGMYLAMLDGPVPQLAVVANILVVAVVGLYVGVRLAVSVPAAVVEGRRWPQALSRSWSLTADHWSHVLATLVLAVLASGLVGALLTALLVPAGSLLEVVTGWSVPDGWLARTLVQAAVNALTVPWLLIVWVLLYLDLRARAVDDR